MSDNKTRITDDMTVQDSILIMADGNPGAIICMKQMIQTDADLAIMDILLLDTYGIYGSKIYTLWKDCCDRDMAKLRATFDAFCDGKFSKEQIQKNLSLTKPVPFI